MQLQVAPNLDNLDSLPLWLWAAGTPGANITCWGCRRLKRKRIRAHAGIEPQNPAESLGLDELREIGVRYFQYQTFFWYKNSRNNAYPEWH